MKKTFCDACKREGPVRRFSLPCYLAEEGGEVGGYVVPTDEPGKVWEQTSGREVHIDLCLACSNRADAAFIAAIVKRGYEKPDPRELRRKS